MTAVRRASVSKHRGIGRAVDQISFEARTGRFVYRIRRADSFHETTAR